MKNRLLAALFVFMLAFSSNLFALTATYDQKVSIKGDPVATIKVSIKENKLKAESAMGGMTAVMLENETGAYNYLPEQKIATKIPAEIVKRPNITHDIPRFMDYLKQNNAQPAGSEKIGDYDTDIYTFIEPMTQKNAKAWVWKEKQFPVKIEVEAPEGLTTIEMSNIQFDVKLDDSVFQLPADAKVMDLPMAPPGINPPTGEEEAPAAAPPAQ